ILVTHAGWRGVFLVNLPIGLIGMYLTLRHAAPSGGRHQRDLDWRGQAAAILALAAMATALIEAGQLGWRHGLVQGGALLAVLATLAFLRIEARSASPMLPLTLFRIRTFSVVSLAGVAVNFAYYGLIFVFSLFFQTQQHLSPQQAGLAFLPMTVVLMAVNVLAGRLIARVGPRVLMVTGLLLAALGYLLLMPVSIGGGYAPLI
ncbi:MFS transporter, partial [Stenotrophomonas sp. P5_B8]